MTKEVAGMASPSFFECFSGSNDGDLRLKRRKSALEHYDQIE